jgi:hypothetical protein
MTESMRRIVNHLSSRPKKLFLIDSLGALTTACMLFGVLKNFSAYFGMPESIVTSLSVIALCFCVYSMTCFFVLKANWSPFLKTISLANLLYCTLTFGLVIFNHAQLTWIGMAYFFGEILIICGLVYLELKVAFQFDKTKMELNEEE